MAARETASPAHSGARERAKSRAKLHMNLVRGFRTQIIDERCSNQACVFRRHPSDGPVLHQESIGHVARVLLVAGWRQKACASGG